MIARAAAALIRRHCYKMKSSPRFMLVAIALVRAVNGALFPVDMTAEDEATRGGRARRSVFPTTGTYARWPTPTAIPYFFESSFPTASRQAVRDAAVAVSNALGTTCIAFTEITAVPSVSTTPYIVISETARPPGRGTPPTTALICDANPGRYRLNNTVINYMSVVTAPSTDTARIGCNLDQRVLRGLFFRILGFYPEWDRPDRDQSITVNRANMAPAAQASIAMAPLRASDAVAIGVFDFSSITFPSTMYFSPTTPSPRPDVFTANGGEAFGNNGNDVPSRLDCLAARSLYRTSNMACNANTCPTN